MDIIYIPSEFIVPITITDADGNLIDIDSLANLVVWLRVNETSIAKYSILPLTDHKSIIRDDSTHYHVNFSKSDQVGWERGYLQIGVKYSVTDANFDDGSIDTFAWANTKVLMEVKPISSI